MLPFRVLLIDHEDSFVHTLANYVRQCGAEVSTIRAGLSIEEVEKFAPDMVLMSPGPGCPDDFASPAMIGALASRRIPIFGVCLGLQSIVQHFGGKLDILPTPVHGKPYAMHVNTKVKSYVVPRAANMADLLSVHCLVRLEYAQVRYSHPNNLSDRWQISHERDA
jgi:anthranilate synthase